MGEHGPGRRYGSNQNLRELGDTMDYVAREVCTGVQKRMDERFDRDNVRISSIEESQAELVKISARLTVLLEKQDQALEDHGSRLREMEKRPQGWMDKILSAIIATLVSGFVAYLFVLKG